MIADRGPRCGLYPDGYQCWKQAGHTDACESYEQQLGQRRNPSTGEATVQSVPSADGSTGNRAGAPGRDDAPAPAAAAIPAAVGGDHAWHTWRSKGVGASDVATIIGASPWGSVIELWAEKRGQRITEPRPESLAQAMGKRLEALTISTVERALSVHIVGEQTWCNATDRPWHLCTPDGFAVTQPHHTIAEAFAGVEVKAYASAWSDERPAGDDWHVLIDPADVEIHVLLQCQWGMHVTGLNQWIVANLTRTFGAPKVELVVLERDQAAIDILVEAVDAFWQHVQDGTEPPVVTGRDADALVRLHWDDEHEPVDLGKEAAELAAAYDAAVAAEKEASDRKAEARRSLLALAPSASRVFADGQSVFSIGRSERTSWVGGQVDPHALRVLGLDRPQALAHLRTTTPVTTLRRSTKK